MCVCVRTSVVNAALRGRAALPSFCFSEAATFLLERRQASCTFHDDSSKQTAKVKDDIGHFEFQRGLRATCERLGRRHAGAVPLRRASALQECRPANSLFSFKTQIRKIFPLLNLRTCLWLSRWAEPIKHFPAAHYDSGGLQQSLCRRLALLVVCFLFFFLLS